MSGTIIQDQAVNVYIDGVFVGDTNWNGGTFIVSAGSHQLGFDEQVTVPQLEQTLFFAGATDIQTEYNILATITPSLSM